MARGTGSVSSPIRCPFRTSRRLFSVKEDFWLTCPYCGEEVEVHVEADVAGSFVQDCEVCCNPWSLRVVEGRDDGEEREVVVTRADGSD